MDEISKKISIKKIDWLLIIGVVLAPMTNLRIWKVGPGEVFCFLWVILNIRTLKIQINFITKFFITFLGSMFIGSIICHFVSPAELRLVDWFTWIYLAFFSYNMYVVLKKNSKEYNAKVLYTICLLTSIFYSLLYLYSVYVNSVLFGVSLWYGSSGYRFSGGASNPHQIAVLLCAVSFVFAGEVINKRRVILNSFLIIISVYIMFATKSATGVLSILFGFISMAIIMILNRIKKQIIKVIVVISGVFISAIAFLIGYPILYKVFMSFMESDANGSSRLEIFSHFGETFLKSPLFGLGPGIHSFWGPVRMEYHNSYLEIVAAAGLIGGVALIVFLIYLFKRVSKNTAFIPTLVSISIYGMAGFTMRRIVFWAVIVFIVVLCESNEKEIHMQLGK